MKASACSKLGKTGHLLFSQNLQQMKYDFATYTSIVSTKSTLYFSAVQIMYDYYQFKYDQIREQS